MSEILSYSQIKKQCDSEWVLLGDPETTDDLTVKSGSILWHSKDRDEVYRKARELKPTHSAILYFGQMPDDVAIVL